MPGPPQIIPDEKALTVFTDGSSLPAPRRGGVGVHFVHTDSLGNETGFDLDEVGYVGGTNNKMELQAVITALRTINSGRLPPAMLDGITKIDIYTDAQYVANNFGSAIFGWPANDWHTREGAPVLNADLWKELVREYKKARNGLRCSVEIAWGKGHSSSNPHNKTADKLAKESARKAMRTLDGAVVVRRKQTKQVTRLGSVEMLGQRLTIRIVSAEPVALTKLSRYRYEVVSRGSPFFGCIDFAFSNDPTVRPGHTYFVRMGVDQGNPQIICVFREKLDTRAPEADADA